VAFAALAMGGWALFANRAHGMDEAIRPALAQGLMSGLITLLLKRALEAMSGLFQGRLAYSWPPTITATVILVTLVVVHELIGTPEVGRTIAVPWTVSTLYALVYSAALARLKAKAP
jgi:hypothetical protein